ncbi:MAG TPA: CDP-alcohol phosphatidyltransferase family protein [Ktedonobacterales bacterium]
MGSPAPRDQPVRARPATWPADIRAVAIGVALGVLVLASGAMLAWYGAVVALRFAAALLAALLVQQAFVTIMRRATGPERSTPADALTLTRASAGGVLAGIAASGVHDRVGLAGWLACGAVVAGATVLDWVDGPLARRLGPTNLGGALDIEADSWVTLWSGVAAVTLSGLPWWCVLAPMLHYARPALAIRRGGLPAGGDPWWGRVTGVAQMALFIAALAPVTGPIRDSALPVLAPPIGAAQLLVMLVLVARLASGHRELITSSRRAGGRADS